MSKLREKSARAAESSFDSATSDRNWRLACHGRVDGTRDALYAQRDNIGDAIQNSRRCSWSKRAIIYIRHSISC